MLGYMAGAATVNIIVLAERLGLFKHMAGRPAATTQDIADGLGLSERWIREILHQLVRNCVCHIVHAWAPVCRLARHASMGSVLVSCAVCLPRGAVDVRQAGQHPWEARGAHAMH
jgi:hypothetical protein